MMTRTKAKFFKKTMASGLVVSVLLTVLPGCTARHMPDWSRVQAVSPQTKTHVRLYSNQKVRGSFHSAADDSLTLTLRDGQERTLPKESVHKVLTRRAWWEGLPGWIVVAASASLAGWLYTTPVPIAPTLLVELRPSLYIHLHPQTSKRLHLRFYFGRTEHPERIE